MLPKIKNAWSFDFWNSKRSASTVKTKRATTYHLKLKKGILDPISSIFCQTRLVYLCLADNCGVNSN